MKKIIGFLIAALFMTGCASVSNSTDVSEEPVSSFDTELNILTPSGAPALALVDLFENNADNITVVEGADVLQASFVSPESEYDVIVAPTNLGVKLAMAGKSEYRLAAVITWGNLYVVAESEEALKDSELSFAAFGEQAVPGLVFESVKDQTEISDVTYYNSVTEAQAALLSGNADAALIAEPAATATIAKGQESGKTLMIAADIQALWKAKTQNNGYPQAGIFVKNTDENSVQIDELLNFIENSMLRYENAESTDALIAAIDAAGCETLGVPSAQLVAKSYERMGLRYVSAALCEAELTNFLALFDIAYDASKALR